MDSYVYLVNKEIAQLSLAQQQHSPAQPSQASWQLVAADDSCHQLSEPPMQSNLALAHKSKVVQLIYKPQKKHLIIA